MRVRRAVPADFAALAAMRRCLHPEAEPVSLDRETADMLAATAVEIAFVAEAEADGLCGFATVGVRSYAEGCDGPTACLEGIWVTPASRRNKVAQALLAGVEDWLRDQGAACLASDALLENQASQAWHRSAGFEEVERSVHYRKVIRNPA